MDSDRPNLNDQCLSGSDEEPHHQDSLSTSPISPQKKPPTLLCLNCGELGHLIKRCSRTNVSDEDRVHMDEIVRIRQAEIKEAKRIRRAELRQTPENKKKAREYELSDRRKEAYQLRRSSDEYKEKQKEYRESDEYKAKYLFIYSMIFI